MNAQIITTRDAAKFARLDDSQNQGKRLVECSFRAPARYAACLVQDTAWQEVETNVTNSTYRQLLIAVLDKAAKNILAARIENMAVFPLEIDDAIFNADAILAEAIGGNSEWMTKEELTQAWEASKTRAKFIGDARYASNQQYRKAVNAYADMVLKLAGKTTVLKVEECDAIIAKMSADDMDTELGAFIARRIEQIRNKPQRDSIDLDCL